MVETVVRTARVIRFQEPPLTVEYGAGFVGSKPRLKPKSRVEGLGFTIMENQMAKNMEHEMEPGSSVNLQVAAHLHNSAAKLCG